jgi:translation initiation factor 1
MAKQKDRVNIVYSTNPNFTYETKEDEVQETRAPEKQDLRVQLDRKQRAGKQVTLITGFIGTEEDLNHLGKKLKNLCGSGGSAKEGEILVQGDHRTKILEYLKKEGFKAKLSGG